MKLFNKNAKTATTDASSIYRLNQPYFLTKNHAKSNVEFKYLNNPTDRTVTVAYQSSLLKRRAR